MQHQERVSTNSIKISIVIPAYNEEKYIASTIECFLKMAYHPLEVIVVDDGSTDRTAEIARQFPVKVIRIEHSGPAKAKNVGIKEAVGDLIVIHDANDMIIDDSYLTKIVETYMSSERKADVILMPMKLLPRRRRLINKAMFVRDYLAYRPKMENGIPVVLLLHTAAFKGDFLKRYAEYREDLGTMEDTLFLTKKNPHKTISRHTSMRAIGGAMDSLKQMMSRWVWGGKSLIPVWKYSKRTFLLKAGYAIYTASLIIALPLVIFDVNILLLYAPFLIRTFYRTGKAYFCTRDIAISLLLPLLDLLLGLCYFTGLLKALILVALKRYTPAK